MTTFGLQYHEVVRSFGGAMGETRERGVKATATGIDKLENAKAAQRNEDNQPWTYTDLSKATGISEKRVRAFLQGEKVDQSTARSICQALALDFNEVIDKTGQINNDLPTPTDRIGQISNNPFIYGDPVPPEKFYGRQRARLEIKNRIGSIASQSINIVGLRRMGKTSLLHYIRSRPTEFIAANLQPTIVYLDLQSSSLFNTPEGVVEGLRRGILQQQGREPWKRDENSDGWAVQEGLEALRDRGVRLIVILDEFEAIASRLEQFQGWGEDWRSMASTQGLFSLVVASKSPISEIYQDLGLTSPFGNIFSTTILGALELADWQQLVRDGFARSRVDETTLNWIDELAGGWPFYVQMAAGLLWQEGDIARAEAAFKLQAQPRFRELWQNLSEVGKRVIREENRERPLFKQLQRYGMIRADGKVFSRVFAELMWG